MGTTTSQTERGKLRQLGKYELIARIAAGGMAEVFLARQLGMMNFQKVVVVKLIHPHLSQERQFVEMFLDEARISALIKHHNVVDIYDLGLDDETYFIAMEYIAGQALSRLISSGATGKRLDIFATCRIIAEAATGLDAAHNLTSITGEHLELVHRDVSPGNILVSYAGAIKLVDFGVSQSLSQLKTSTENTQLKGKLGYASPEQLEEQPLDHRSDLFSLGVVLWESLSLTRLYRAESPAATVRKILAGNPPPPSALRPEVPPALDAITLKALALNPADRYQSAVQLRDELVALLREANYHGDERTIAAYMNDAFSEQRAAGEELLRRVADAAEEICVEIDLAAELDDVRDDSIRRAAEHDELEPDITVAEPELPAEIERSALPAANLVVPAVSARQPELIAAIDPDLTIRKKRGFLTVILAAAALAALAIFGVAILGVASEPKRANPVVVEEAGAVSVPAPAPDASIPPEMIGVPSAESVAGPQATSLAEARDLYLVGLKKAQAGDGSAARVEFRAALRKSEGFSPALRGLALSYYKENRKSKARYYLGKYLQEVPRAPDAERIRTLLIELAK